LSSKLYYLFFIKKTISKIINGKILLSAFVFLIFFSCSKQESINPSNQKYVILKFEANNTNNKEINDVITFKVDVKNSQLVSEKLKIIKALNQETQKQGSVYIMRSVQELQEIPDATGLGCESGIFKGYFYNEETTCLFYGTLYVGKDCNSIFVACKECIGFDPICGVTRQL
jgi:hypothetical protein